MEKLICVGGYWTGSRRGYIRVANQGVESTPAEIPESLVGLRGNKRWALWKLKAMGATHYTIKDCQGVPGKGYSNQYCYSIYTGYKKAPLDVPDPAGQPEAI